MEAFVLELDELDFVVEEGYLFVEVLVLVAELLVERYELLVGVGHGDEVLFELLVGGLLQGGVEEGLQVRGAEEVAGLRRQHTLEYYL